MIKKDVMTRKEKAVLAKKNLIEAARTLIAERGYESISVTDITDACDMSVGNFYHYFKSKEDIITALEVDPYDQLVKDISEAGKKSVAEQVRSFITQYMVYSLQYSTNFYRQWYYQHLKPIEDPEKMTKIEADIARLSQILIKGVTAGEFVKDCPIDDIARTIIFELYGTIICYIMSNGTFDAGRWAAKFSDFTIDTLLKPYFIENTATD